MKTFIESLKITNNMALLKETFICMSEKGVDPNKFVEWYSNVGLEADTDQAEKWLTDELFLVEGSIRNWMNRNITPTAQKMGGMAGYMAGAGAGGVVDTAGGAYDVAKAGAQHFAGGAQQGWKSMLGEPKPTAEKPVMAQPEQKPETPAMTSNPHIQHIKSAHEALSTLSLRMNKSKALKEKIGGDAFQATIVRLMKMLKDMEQIPVSIPFQQPQQQAQQAAESHDYKFFYHVNQIKKQRQYAEINRRLKDLEQYGINPESFVDWYAEEGRLLNENWWDNASDFGGNLWANAKDAWQNKNKGIKHVWNNWGQAGQDRQARVDGERDTNAVQNAVKALGELEKEVGNNVPGDFLELLTKVHDKLADSKTEPEVEKVPDPETQQAQEPESQPEPVQQQVQEPQQQEPEPEQQEPEPEVQQQQEPEPEVQQQQEPEPEPEVQQQQAPEPEPEVQQQQAPEPEQTPEPQQQAKPEQAPKESGLALTSKFWDTGDFKVARDKLVHQVKNMGFVKNDGTKLEIPHDHPRPSIVLKDIITSGKTDMYTNPEGQNLKDFLQNWSPDAHESTKGLPSFYEFMARRSLR